MLLELYKNDSLGIYNVLSKIRLQLNDFPLLLNSYLSENKFQEAGKLCHELCNSMALLSRQSFKIKLKEFELFLLEKKTIAFDIKDSAILKEIIFLNNESADFVEQQIKNYE